MWESLPSGHHAALHTVVFRICKDPQLLIQSCLAREAAYTRLPGSGVGGPATCSPPHLHIWNPAPPATAGPFSYFPKGRHRDPTRQPLPAIPPPA